MRRVGTWVIGLAVASVLITFAWTYNSVPALPSSVTDTMVEENYKNADGSKWPEGARWPFPAWKRLIMNIKDYLNHPHLTKQNARRKTAVVAAGVVILALAVVAYLYSKKTKLRETDNILFDDDKD